MDNKLKYQIDLSLKDLVSSSLAKVRKGFEELGKKAEEAQEKAAGFGNVCERISKIQFKNMADMLDRSVQVFQEATGSGMEYEQAMADLVAITGIAGKELEEIGRVARKTGEESGLGATGAVNAFTLLASQIQIDKIGLQGLMTLQKETITLAQAAGMDMTDAATAMAATINQFGLEATEANRVINVLAAGSKYGAAEISDLAQSFKVTGSTAAAAGLSVEQTAGALEVLSQSNLKGAEAGTALRNILLKMQTVLGIDFTKNGLDEALAALQPKLDDVTYLAKLFGAENIAAAQYLITNAQAVGELTEQVTGTNVAQEQAAIRTNTAAEEYKRLQAKVDDLKISFFNATGAAAPMIALIGDNLPIIASMMTLVGSTAQTIDFFRKNAILARTAIVAKTAAELASAGVMKIVAAGQAALNAVMSANPVALVVLAIAALVAGLVALYNRSESFRKVVDALWDGLKRVASVVYNSVITAFERCLNTVQTLWKTFKQLVGLGGELEEAGGKVAAAGEEMDSANESEEKSTDELNNELKEEGKSIATIAGLEERLNGLRQKQKESSLQNAIAVQKEIDAYEQRLVALKKQIALGSHGMERLGDNNYKEALELPGLKGVDAPPSLDIPIKFEVSENKIKENLMKMRQQFSDSIKEMVVFSEEQINGLVTSAFAGLGEAIASGSPLEMLKRMLITVMDMLQQFGTALIAAGAASEALKVVAWSGVGAIVAGGALVAATAAAKAALSKATAFAEGGIVSGPTLALVGEYGGASNNPEVIAPLDKLRSLIDTDRADGGFGEVRFEIRGDVLEGILKKVNNRRRRTR
nr:MAG TPA: minor tail protein [Caudoviricetes sp.]